MRTPRTSIFEQLHLLYLGISNVVLVGRQVCRNMSFYLPSLDQNEVGDSKNEVGPHFLGNEIIDCEMLLNIKMDDLGVPLFLEIPTSYPQFLETFPKPQDFEPQVGVSVFRDKGLASALSSVPSRQRFGIPPEEIIPLVGEPRMVELRWLGSFRAEDWWIYKFNGFQR